LRHCSGLEALLHQVANPSGQIECRLRLHCLGSCRQGTEKRFARPPPYLLPQYSNVDVYGSLFFLCDCDAFSALAAQFNGQVQGNSLVRSVSRGSEP
jgi:hypothetical protein